MMNEKVETVMIKKLITLSPLDTLDHATKIFSDKRIHHLPVQDEGKLVGLVTTYDIWKISMEKSLDGSTLVRDIMSKRW
ncbi:MAG: CBS domain-containing protein [Saprospiraceae bacterium]|nr:CBS domain-containing protein [Saprospiraceae bacterium]MBK8081816.1 CBS domain-containing protein [Saprospiraceae bacterium]